MAKRKPTLTPITDKEQSKKFREAARELEADGGLNLTEAKEKFEKGFEKVVKRRSDS